MLQFAALAQAPTTNLLYTSILLILLGIFAVGWLIIHVEQSRHRSTTKIALALILGAILIGFGVHFFLLSSGI